MTSFLKNLKSTLLESEKKKMPSRHRPNEDPFKRINSWDDGYEYINGGDRSMDGAPGPMYSPPPQKPTRRSTYEPEYKRDRHAYPPSPPDSDDDAPRRHRRGARRSPSPPRRRESKRESDRYRDDAAPRPRRPNLDSHFTAPPPKTRDSPRAYSRSPSPPRARRDDFGRRHHERSPSPPRRRPSTRDYPDHSHRDSYRDTHHRSAPRSNGSGNSDKKYPPRAGENRPPISRSKTTSAAGPNVSKTGGNGIPSLSPRWQKAAQAAFTAGSAAALKVSSQPGAWNGQKGAKVATAALGAAAMDMFLKKKNGGGDDDRDREREREQERDRDRDRERDRERGGGNRRKSEVLGDFVGDFLTDQFNKRTSGRR